MIIIREKIVKYTCEGDPIGGLSKNSEYYLTKVDNDSFKLSEINIQENGERKISSTRYKQYVKHYKLLVQELIYFNYQDISVKVVGKVGISL